MTLGDKLRQHRASHPECDRKCQEYLAIARAAVQKRQVWEGPRHAHSRLSVVEAKLD